MTVLALFVVAYAAGAGVLLALSPAWARSLGVEPREMRAAMWHAVVAAPLIFAGLIATLALLATA